MNHVAVTANLDLNPWTDLLEQTPLTEGELVRIGMLPNGTQSGRAVVAMHVVVDGKPVFVQVTWRIWQAINAALSGTPTAQMEDL